MSKVVIEFRYSQDESDCDLCGPDWEEGLEVLVDGVVVAGEPANAGCCSKSEYPTDLQILRGVLSALISDFEIKETYIE